MSIRYEGVTTMELNSFIQLLHDELLFAGADESILKEISLFNMNSPSILSSRNLIKSLLSCTSQNEIEELNEEIDSLKEDNNDLEYKVDDLSLELDNAKDEINSLNNTIKELKEENNNLVTEINFLNKENNYKLP